MYESDVSQSVKVGFMDYVPDTALRAFIRRFDEEKKLNEIAQNIKKEKIHVDLYNKGDLMEQFLKIVNCDIVHDKS